MCLLRGMSNKIESKYLKIKRVSSTAADRKNKVLGRERKVSWIVSIKAIHNPLKEALRKVLPRMSLLKRVKAFLMRETNTKNMRKTERTLLLRELCKEKLFAEAVEEFCSSPWKVKLKISTTTIIIQMKLTRMQMTATELMPYLKIISSQTLVPSVLRLDSKAWIRICTFKQILRDK